MPIDPDTVVTALEAAPPDISPDAEPQPALSEDEQFLAVAQRILKKHKAAFEELAK